MEAPVCTSVLCVAKAVGSEPHVGILLVVLAAHFKPDVSTKRSLSLSMANKYFTADVFVQPMDTTVINNQSLQEEKVPTSTAATKQQI